MTILSELQTLCDANGGELTPELVVQVAQQPEHPLHSQFEWDDSVAGAKYRLGQASQLLRITYNPNPADTGPRLRAFVQARNQSRAPYVPLPVAMADPVARAVVLAQMEREWHAFYRRWKDTSDFAGFAESVIAPTLPAAG